ncbi:Mg chelatase, cobalamin biosynthesis protein CobN [Rhizobium leguminosarum bv. trifolii WSM2297]|uniref:Mg chelatase, cobalamin biosynthesis protein CobN n=1 Tax=Rhizobium leguminosarum bv. trifolii WSM2297 TaxID=754762 RepID=J0CW77_RHILT|nr:DUF1236 domain-containing protein [Rhizobium leguminosarum]EJC84180.1 Mg chelatase, cobalamin biosynthesis protein CobN [Rhizobium leguminosarum bv. trifolii WSM2297]
MKSNHLAMLVTALSLSVSPLATLPAAAQQDTKSSGQAQSGTDAGSQSGSAKTGSDCTPDASGACPGKGQSSQQKSGEGSEMKKSAEQPSTEGSTSGSAPGKTSTETKPASKDASGGTTIEQKPAAKSGDSSGSVTTGTKSTTQSGDASKQSTDQNATTTNKSSSETNVNISVEQQTEIRTVVKEVHVAPVKEVDFTVSVGTKIPKKVRLERLPKRIVKIVPQYEGYRFFILADGRIVIVDPDALTIVYIIEA